jgi:hypothetical protein
LVEIAECLLVTCGREEFKRYDGADGEEPSVAGCFPSAADRGSGAPIPGGGVEDERRA